MSLTSRYSHHTVRSILGHQLTSYSERVLERASIAMGEPEKNPFKQVAYRPEHRVIASLSRSMDSVMGNSLEALYAHLAAARSGVRVQPAIAGFGTQAHEIEGLRAKGDLYMDGTPKTVIWTRLDKEAVSAAASRLMLAITERRVKLGTPEFTAELDRERRALQKHPVLCADPYPAVVDFWDPQVGWGEIKLGGNLDTAKAPEEVEALVRVALTLNETRPPTLIALYSSGSDEGKIAGSLPRLVDERALLVGHAAWDAVLPDGMGHERFMRVYAQEHDKRSAALMELLGA